MKLVFSLITIILSLGCTSVDPQSIRLKEKLSLAIEDRNSADTDFSERYKTALADLNPDEIKKKADQGEVDSLITLGHMYLFGVNAGIEEDELQAKKYITQAAEKGSAYAQYIMASFFSFED